jgi:hypothetical protein
VKNLKIKIIKTLFLFLIFSIGIQKAFSQTYKFEATGFSVLEKDNKGGWGSWSELQPVNIVITLDTDKNRIIVYSKEIQLYEIQNYEEKQESETDEIYPFVCKDIDGEEFTISIITRKNQNNRKQLYINQKNVIIVYNIVNFPDKGINETAVKK